MPQRIDLHLRIRVKPGMRLQFLQFLRETIPLHEAPGGITLRLLEDLHDQHRFIVLVLYENLVCYERDQLRLRTDPQIIERLAQSQALLAEPPVIETYRLQSPLPEPS